jgi:hypothetical protein
MATIYICTECGYWDKDRSATPATSLICTNAKCRAGRDPREGDKRGMFPVVNGYFPWGEPAPKPIPDVYSMLP